MEELLKELKERGIKKVALKFFWSRARKESYVELLPRETGEDLPYALEREVRAKLEESLKDLYAERRGCEVEGALAVDLEKDAVSLSAKGYWPSTEVLVYEFEFPVEVSLELPEELAGLTGPLKGRGRLTPEGALLLGRKTAPPALASALEAALEAAARDAWEKENLVSLEVLKADFSFEVNPKGTLSADGWGLARAFYESKPLGEDGEEVKEPKWRVSKRLPLKRWLENK